MPKLYKVVTDKTTWFTDKFSAGVLAKESESVVETVTVPINLRDWVAWLNENFNYVTESVVQEREVVKPNSDVEHYANIVELQKKVINGLQLKVDEQRRQIKSQQ